MRISELARRVDLPVHTVKHYLRVGLLPPGRPTAATQADYDEAHVSRLRLIRALTDVGGLSLSAAARVLAAVDAGPEGIATAAAEAHEALATGRPRGDGPPEQALAVVRRLGWEVDPRSASLRQLQAALEAVRDAELEPRPEFLDVYAAAALQVAEAELAYTPDPNGPQAGTTVSFIVLGTVLYEPVLLALRRLAQQHLFVSGGNRPQWSCDRDDQPPGAALSD